ncbi:hypothetical protein ACFW1F_02775 [Streptomyces bungoensis]|uniref:hypothetical protein n=1 Tax=Streptomyces bungoensis TaxID=285568 RepID=UPI00343A2E01
MKARSARRLAALSAIGVLMAGGAAIGTAGTASAATPTQLSTNRGCFYGGWWGNCFDRGDFFHHDFFNNTPVVVVVVP